MNVTCLREREGEREIDSEREQRRTTGGEKGKIYSLEMVWNVFLLPKTP